MQRPDRIDYPCITSDELWETVPNETNSSGQWSVDDGHTRNSKYNGRLCTPVLMSPERGFLASSSEIPNYFRYREDNNLVTPAQTPSDILRRGPLYESTPSEAETEPTTARPSLSAREEFLKRQIDHHRERQAAISEFMDQFTQRMHDLRDWHVYQESKYVEELTSRGNPKLTDNFPTTVDYSIPFLFLMKRFPRYN